jgi:transcriptional regulator with XRE-family HTH domain
MDESDRKQLGRRLREARERVGLSAAECARRASTSAHSLWRYEDGRVAPGPSMLVRLANVLDTTVEWLVTGHGRPPAVRRASAAARS